MTRRTDALETIRTRLHNINDPKLDPARTDLDAIAPRAREAFARLMDARPSALAAASYDGPNVTGSTGNDSTTERLALNPQPSVATDIARLDKALRELLVATSRPNLLRPWSVNDYAQDIWRIVNAWTPQQATDKQRREVTAANVAATECKLTRDNLGLFAVVHRTSDLWGLLPEATPVSRWVWRFAKDYRRLPTPMEWQHQRSKDDDLRSQAIATTK